jgi:3-oxoacyl-[acyl-carrier protein] reductase
MAAATHSAFVTGSGRNIGRAIVHELARAGVNVIVNGSSNRDACEGVAREARDLGAEAMVAMGHVGKSQDVARMAAEATARFGRVDIVVNNASVRPTTPFLELSDDRWHEILGIDLHAAFYTARAFLPGMVEGGWGRIVNITGMNAIHGYSGRAPVSVAKHGLWGLTKSLAKEFGPKGITVNAISPGPIMGEAQDPDQKAHIADLATRVPVGHPGAPDDIAAMCGLLCSDRGGFVNGQMVAINGGMQT